MVDRKRRGAAGGIDTSAPNVARIYDYILGGKDNFAADRHAAQQLLAALPDIAGTVRDNRAFIGRVVRFWPARRASASSSTSAPRAHPGLRARDGAGDRAGRAGGVRRQRPGGLLPWPGAARAAGQGWLRARRPAPAAEILRLPDVLARIDFSRPVGVLCACALHFVPDQEKPHQVIAEYRDHLAPGSYLAITHGIAAATPEDYPDGLVESVTDVYRNASAQIHVRPVKDIERFFDGLEILEPGVVWMARWRPDPGTRPALPAEFPVRRRRTQTRRLTADCGAEPHSTAARPIAPAATAVSPWIRQRP